MGQVLDLALLLTAEEQLALLVGLGRALDRSGRLPAALGQAFRAVQPQLQNPPS